MFAILTELFLMPKSFISMVFCIFSILVSLVVTLVVCVPLCTSAVLGGNDDVQLQSNRYLDDLSDSCSYSTSVLVDLDFSSIMSYYEANQIGSDNYTSYSIYTLTNDRVIEGVIDSDAKEHCLVAGDYKFLVEPLEIQQSGETSSEDIYSPVVIRIQRFSDSHKIFNSPITEPLILHLQYNVFPWDVGTQQWSYKASAAENSLLALPSADVSGWSSATAFPDSTSPSSHYYFRTEFSLELLPGYSGFEIRFRAASSSELFVNGVKLYSFEAPNMSVSLPNPSWNTVTGLISTLQSGANTLVVHLKPFSEPTASKTHFFDVSLRLLHDYLFNSLNAELSLAPSSLYPLFNGDLADAWTATIFQGLYNTVTLEFPADSSFLGNQLCLVRLPDGALPARLDVLVVEADAPRLLQTLLLDPADLADSSPCWDLHNFQGYARYQLRIHANSAGDTVSFSELLFQLVAPNDTLSLAYPALSLPVAGPRACVSPTLSPTLPLAFCAAQGPLPAGVALDALTGELCAEGSPETALSEEVSLICRTALGAAEASVHVERAFQACETEGGEPVAHGETVVVGPCGEGYAGSRVKQCVNGVFGEVSDAQCELLPPSGLTYEPAPFYWVGDALSLAPSFANTASAFRANDSFPAGVTLDPASGHIEGPSEEPCDRFIEVVASNSAGESAFVLHLVVRARVCEAQDGWPAAAWGESSRKEGCEEGYEGFLTRPCEDGVFGAVSDAECLLSPPRNLSYAASSSSLDTLFVFDPVELLPSVAGRELLFVAEGLPAGLAIDGESGRVAGRLESDAAVAFTVTATNPAGNATVVVRLRAVFRPCRAEAPLEEAAKGQTAQVGCEAWGLEGVRRFECRLVGEEVKWVQVEDGCVEPGLAAGAGVALLCIVAVVVVVLLLFVALVARSKKREKQFQVRTVDMPYVWIVCCDTDGWGLVGRSITASRAIDVLGSFKGSFFKQSMVCHQCISLFDPLFIPSFINRSNNQSTIH